MEERTCTLKVTAPGKIGYLYSRKGVLINAETSELKGEKAALHILSWNDINIEIIDQINDDRCLISLSLNELLLEASRMKDETRKKNCLDDETIHAVNLVEGHNFKKALTALIQLLKANPNNHHAWVWYARALESMKAIEKALGIAARIAPENPGVQEECIKFEIARKKTDKDQVRRCPICWCPLEINVFECPYCGAKLVIGVKPPRYVLKKDKSRLFDEAISRYKRILENDTTNVNAIYFLGIAHYNLNHLEEALDCIYMAVEGAPDKTFYGNQLKRLLKMMASYETNAVENRAATPPLTPSVSSTGFSDSVVGNHKILVAENSSEIRKMAALTLHQNGYEIIEAKDGFEALRKLAEKPDLILLDNILPKMDGYRVLSVIKANDDLKNIPVIMLMNKNGIVNKVKSKLAGITTYLTKPLKARQLLKTVEMYLD